MISLRPERGASNLVTCVVLLLHVSEEILDENGRFSTYKLDAVDRMPTAKLFSISLSRNILMEPTQQVLASMVGYAPICIVCGHIPIRPGTCYKCLNCGNSLGCY